MAAIPLSAEAATVAFAVSIRCRFTKPRIVKRLTIMIAAATNRKGVTSGGRGSRNSSGSAETVAGVARPGSVFLPLADLVGLSAGMS